MITPPLTLPPFADQVLSGIESMPPAQALATSDWLFPAVESAHVIALTLTVGTIIFVDLRLVGLASLERRLEDLTQALLPLTWIGFACAALTGLSLFCAKASTYGHNPFFLGKMALLACAGLNMAAFHALIEPGMRRTGADGLGRLSGVLSLVFWVGVVTLGRWVGFTI